MNRELNNLNAIEKSTVADLILNDFRDSSQVEFVDKNLSIGERAHKSGKSARQAQLAWT